MLTKCRPIRNDILDGFDWGFFPTVRKFFDEETELSPSIAPKTDIHETDEDYRFTMEMPGVTKENVEVSVEADVLTIKGEKIEKTDRKGLIRQEIRAEKFERSFSLGTNIDRENIEAKMDNGILSVTLPKTKDKVGRKISVA